MQRMSFPNCFQLFWFAFDFQSLNPALTNHLNEKFKLERQTMCPEYCFKWRDILSAVKQNTLFLQNVSKRTGLCGVLVFMQMPALII